MIGYIFGISNLFLSFRFVFSGIISNFECNFRFSENIIWVFRYFFEFSGLILGKYSDTFTVFWVLFEFSGPVWVFRVFWGFIYPNRPGSEQYPNIIGVLRVLKF